MPQSDWLVNSSPLQACGLSYKVLHNRNLDKITMTKETLINQSKWLWIWFNYLWVSASPNTNDHNELPQRTASSQRGAMRRIFPAAMTYYQTTNARTHQHWRISKRSSQDMLDQINDHQRLHIRLSTLNARYAWWTWAKFANRLPPVWNIGNECEALRELAKTFSPSRLVQIGSYTDKVLLAGWIYYYHKRGHYEMYGLTSPAETSVNMPWVYLIDMSCIPSMDIPFYCSLDLYCCSSNGQQVYLQYPAATIWVREIPDRWAWLVPVHSSYTPVRFSWHVSAISRSRSQMSYFWSGLSGMPIRWSFKVQYQLSVLLHGQHSAKLQICSVFVSLNLELDDTLVNSIRCSSRFLFIAHRHIVTKAHSGQR